MIDDVVIVGAGPAGTVAATVLARAGARVRILDRSAFPRAKLCGDTINPGTLALLRRLRLAKAIEATGLAIDGMLLTGDGVAINARYPADLRGRALARRDLDWALVEQAVAAGASFEPRVAVRRLLLDTSGPQATVSGVVAAAASGARTIRARVVIAADGRRSTIAFGLGLAHHPARPRRWAIGAYFEQVGGMSALGEMHVRQGRYVGIAPLPGGVTNVCLVWPWQVREGSLANPAETLQAELARDPMLRDRFTSARLLTPPLVLGPLAVDVTSPAIDGVLLAGDAAGFIDPMTGDGLRFAVRGGELAANAALDALAGGWAGVQPRLARDRGREFRRKWRFNRALRSLVASPAALRLAGALAPVAPSVFQAIVRRAGDCDPGPAC
jgi:flavin-dependent dehydrogenase